MREERPDNCETCGHEPSGASPEYWRTKKIRLEVVYTALRIIALVLGTAGALLGVSLL